MSVYETLAAPVTGKNVGHAALSAAKVWSIRALVRWLGTQELSPERKQTTGFIDRGIITSACRTDKQSR